MQCAFEETSFSLESWTDSAFLIFSVVGIEVGLIVTFLNQVCKNSCDSVLFADFVSSTTTASLCRRCWSFQSEMWKCSAQADRCLFSKQLRLFREFGSSWLCVYYPWSFSFRWSDPNLKRDWLVFVGTSFKCTFGSLEGLWVFGSATFLSSKSSLWTDLLLALSSMHSKRFIFVLCQTRIIYFWWICCVNLVLSQRW